MQNINNPEDLYFKYIALYQLMDDGRKIIKIVDLGLRANRKPIIITKDAYAFKIFFSKKSLNDIAFSYKADPDFNAAPLVYVGKVYKYDEYRKVFPAAPIPKEATKDTLFVKTTTVDETKKLVCYVNPGMNCKITSRKAVYEHFVNVEDPVHLTFFGIYPYKDVR